MEPSYRYFPIDIGDLWDYERPLFLADQSNKSIMKNAISKFETIISKRGKASIVYQNSYHSEEYARYVASRVRRYREATTLKKRIALDYFFSRDHLYQYTQDIIIQHTDKDFDYWFSLKLRQYDMGLKHLTDFLDYHLAQNFEANVEAYLSFLDIVLAQYEQVFFSFRLCQFVKRYMVSITPEAALQVPTKAPIKVEKRPRALDNFHSFKLVAVKQNPRYFITRKEELKELFTDLMDYGFIAEKSSFVTFEHLFTNQKIAPKKRLIWREGKIYLKLCIRFLLDTKKILPMGNDHWYVATQCFVNNDGSEIEITKLSKANGGTDKKKELLYGILERL